ncbi:14-3-3-like protein GF14 iota [Tanacetum coccineum]|uniref:14-3-3-like protein GF14 iota n=1 Tax=Tanacetum coccineum TaxID=301880 RepID=A0ABQ5BRQ0_9ASTR
MVLVYLNDQRSRDDDTSMGVRESVVFVDQSHGHVQRPFWGGVLQLGPVTRPKQAFDKAISELDSRSEESYKDSTLSLHLLNALRESLRDQKLKKFIWLLFSKHFDIIAGNMA